MMGAEDYELEDGTFSDDFHEFALEWDEEEVRWYVDGNKYASLDITSDEFTEFHKEFFILFNIAVGGSFAGRPDDESIFPQMMYIDWVRVYRAKRALSSNDHFLIIQKLAFRLIVFVANLK